MEIEEHGDGKEAPTTMHVHQLGSSSSSPTLYHQTSSSSSSSSSTTSWLSSVDNDDNINDKNYAKNTLRMIRAMLLFPKHSPCTDPPRQQTIVQPLPRRINLINVPLPGVDYHFLPFLGPIQLKPIDLSTPQSLTKVSLDPDIASRIHATHVDREMSASQPKPSRYRVHCRHQPWPARKHVFSKLGVPFISDRQLLTAVRNADSSKVLHYLEEGADPNISDSKGRTPLHVAASQGLNDIASHLLSWRADPNRKDILENTPLHLAVCRGDTRVVNILLRNGANINLKDGVGRTPLCIVQSRLGTLRRDRSISTDKLINECQMISDILRIHCTSQRYRSSTPADVHSVATENVLSSSAIDELCSMMTTISTREQADEIADTMIETMSQMRIEQAEQEQQQKYFLPIL